MPIDSGYELLGSPILFDTRTLAVRRQTRDRKLPWHLRTPTTSPNFISRLYVLLTSLGL